MALNDRSRWRGAAYAGSRYTDGIVLIRDKNTDAPASLVALPFITIDAFNVLKGTGATSVQNVNPATGYVDMGPVDEIEIMFGLSDAGPTDNGSVAYQINAFTPVFNNAVDPGRTNILGYEQSLVASGVATGSTALLLGAAGVAALANGTGMSATLDFVADTITQTVTTTGISHFNLLVPQANAGVASLSVRVPGAIGIQVLTRLPGGTTATSAFVYGCRRQGSTTKAN